MFYRRATGWIVVVAVGLDLNAALSDFGLAYARTWRSRISLKDVLSECLRIVPAFSRIHLYYPSRRHPSSAFALLVDALR
jgi:hypothetical protein